jgi:hypothetical protein
MALMGGGPRHCERSEAIQGSVHQPLDCFVASLLAMTEVRVGTRLRRFAHPTNHASLAASLPSAAWAAARRAIGTRNGEQET